MKNKLILFLLTAFALMPGCKNAASDIKEWDRFQDPIFKATFMYPKDWYVVKEPSRVLIYNSVEVADKFFTKDPRKPDGIQIIIASERSDTMQDYVKYISAYRSDQETSGYTIKATVVTKMEDLPAQQVTYTGIVEEEQQTRITTTRIATLKDSTIYYAQYSGFNKAYEPYKFVFDSILASLVLPRKIVLAKGVDPAIPLAQVEKYNDNYLQLECPANFSSSELPKKGDMISGVKFTGNQPGMRNDCDINIDIRPAKKLTLEKVVAQNSKKIIAVSKGNTTISGEKAVFFVETPVKNIERQTYFVVKNDNFYRIILTYYSPMKKNFLPAFEKVVASIRLK